MPDNAYKYDVPLEIDSDNLVIVERKPLIKDVIEGLLSGKYWSVISPRLGGKSILLKQIANRFPNAYCLYFDLNKYPKKEESFYKELIATILLNVPSDKTLSEVPVLEEDNAGIIFVDFLKDFTPQNQSKRIIFLFDHICGLPFLEGLLKIIRKMFHERHDNSNQLHRFGVVLAVDCDLTEASIGETSPYNISEQLILKDLSYEESYQLINLPLEYYGIHITLDAIEYLITQTGGHPQLLQHCCSIMMNIVMNTNQTITLNIVKDAVNELITQSFLIDNLIKDVENDEDLQYLIADILDGKSKRFFPFKEFANLGIGAIVDDNNICAIRNPIFERVLCEMRENGWK
jgi:hypothetical protein